MPVWHYLKPEQDGNCRERKTINIVVPFRSYTTPNIKLQKIAKKFKKLNNTIMAPV